jgi:hypothetical protein
MVVRGEKLEGTRGSVNRLWIRTGALFLGSSASVQLCWVNVKGCYVRLVISAYVLCVLGFSDWMYINLNRRDSRI